MSFSAAKDATAQQVADPFRAALTARILSALILAPPVLAAIYYGPPYFDILVGLALLVMAWEWNRLVRGPSRELSLGRLAWLAGGFLYIGVPSLALLWLRAEGDVGRHTVFWLMALVWAADSGAYTFGLLIGGPKLAPRISPKKTWAGFGGGVFCAAAAGAVGAFLLGKDNLLPLSALSAALGGVSQLGDLLESWVKRHFGVKDTSNLIPGHGGLLDRVDGLLAGATAAALLSWAVQGNILKWL